MVKIDYLYGANWSLWLDVKILLRTIPVALGRRGLERSRADLSRSARCAILPGMEAGESSLWKGVDRLVDWSPSFSDLKSHGLHLLAARHYREQGVPLPEEVADEVGDAAWRDLMAPAVLKGVREAYDGRLLLLKGPEVAAHYPIGCRPFNDLDILADDAEKAQGALLAAGFERVGFEEAYYEGLHHLSPLRMPGAPSPVIEIHRRPNWLEWSEPPSGAELFGSAVPTSTVVDGFLALPPAQHAVVMAAHGWIELPLRRILDLVDVLAVLPSGERNDARSWPGSGGWSESGRPRSRRRTPSFWAARRPRRCVSGRGISRRSDTDGSRDPPPAPVQPLLGAPPAPCLHGQHHDGRPRVDADPIGAVVEQDSPDVAGRPKPPSLLGGAL